MKFRIITSALLLLSVFSFGQNDVIPTKKGKFYTAWGWNRGYYTKSDIYFSGQNYNFTLKDVKAVDRPYNFDPTVHLNPAKLTIPQTNFRLGYYFHEKYSFVFGIDHMKYVMIQDQQVKIDGKIENSGTEYDGTYENETLELASSFLEYENTDGLNYFFFELNRHHQLFSLNRKNGKELLMLELSEGVSLGGMYPRTDSHLMLYKRNNEFHLTGYGTGVKGALRLQFLRHFFVQSEMKGGYINMPGLKATEFNSEHAEQHFFYFQTNILLGGIFKIPGT